MHQQEKQGFHKLALLMNICAIYRELSVSGSNTRQVSLD
jgi:hypothetical protein